MQSWKQCALLVKCVLCGNSCNWVHDKGYTLLVPMNQRVLNNLSKEYSISGHKWSMTHSVPISQKLPHEFHELPQSHCDDNREGTVFSWLYYITFILLLWDLSALCIVDHLWPLILCSLLSLLSSLWFIGTSNV